MSTDTAWPYDADQHDPLTALRIPVTGAYPQKGYLACFYVDPSGNGRAGDTPRPTDAEAAMLASYIAYLRTKYEPHVQRRMAAEPLDTGDLAALVFSKRDNGSWAYRRAHWTEGPFFWPPFGGGVRLALGALLDHVVTSGGASKAPEWEAWKAAHREAFAA
jgi:hypothetical protein